MTRIAINYRREDTSPWAGRLYDHLVQAFGRDHVFMDIDTLEPGADFVEEINRAVAESQVLIAVIGPDWATIKDPKGNRRLDNPMDFVRMEIVAALQYKIRVIPVLVGGATMPAPGELPDDLAVLARRHAIGISDLRFRTDVDRLIASIKLVLERIARAAPTPDATPAPGRRSGAAPRPSGPPAKRPTPPSAASSPPPGEGRAAPAEAPPPTPTPGPATPGRAEVRGRSAATPRSVLHELLGAGGPALRHWKHWLVLIASFWVADRASFMAAGAGTLGSWWFLLSSMTGSVAFVFSSVYCLSALRSTALAITGSGLVHAGVTGAFAPPGYTLGPPTSPVIFGALAIVLLMVVVTVANRRSWRASLGIAAVVSVGAALVELVRWKAFAPEYAGLFGRVTVNRMIWSVTILAGLGLVVPRLRSRPAGILLAVLAASVLTWLVDWVIHGGGPLELLPRAVDIVITAAGIWVGSTFFSGFDRGGPRVASPP